MRKVVSVFVSWIVEVVVNPVFQSSFLRKSYENLISPVLDNWLIIKYYRSNAEAELRLISHYCVCLLIDDPPITDIGRKILRGGPSWPSRMRPCPPLMAKK